MSLEFEPKSKYNEKRDTYFKDKKFYCYRFSTAIKGEMLVKKINVNEIPVAIQKALDDLDIEEDQCDRKEMRYRDAFCDLESMWYVHSYSNQGNPKLSVMTSGQCEDIDTALAINGMTKEDLLSQVRACVEKDFSDDQKDMFYMWFGECMTLKEIAVVIKERTGREITEQAVYSRIQKLISKVAKRIGVSPVKDRKRKKR